MFPESGTVSVARAGLASGWRRYRQAWRDLYQHRELPGYGDLPAWTRCSLNFVALRYFICSIEFIRLLYCGCIWWLCALITIVSFDLPETTGTKLTWLSLVWCLPWFADARRRHVAALLQHRWSDREGSG